MFAIDTMKNSMNTKTMNFILLGLVTGSIYNILWMNKATQVISDTTKTNLVDSTYIIWLSVCLGLSYLLSGTGDDMMNGLSAILVIAGLVLQIVWAFKAKTALTQYVLHEHRIDLKMNVFYTVILHLFYINYCINHLPEEERKQRILSGQ